MAEYLGSMVVCAILREICEDLYAIVKLQFTYLCCFRNNVRSMQEEAQQLADVRAELERTVSNTWKKREDIVPTVNTWLENTSAILREVREEIEPKIPNSESGCWAKTKTSFSLGKKVKVKTKDMKNLRNEGKGFNSVNIFHPMPTPAMLPFLHSRTLELKSRKLIEDGIVKVLNEGEVKIVGVCGMGGVGKTTMAENILSRMQIEGSFAGVVKVVVSQPVVLQKIQQVIMDSLDFKDEEKKVENLEVRARLLSSKLQGPKKLLILLDDIWEELSFEELGIPREGGCATLITSRDKVVLDEMCGNNVFEIGTLLQDEARSLFEERARIHLNNLNFSPTAEQIIEECGGLPLAIVIIASALRNKAKQLWDRALRELKGCRPIDGTVYVELHKRLVISYELLDDEDAKFLFLLCSLFPEDHQISIDNLALYIMGLNEVDSLVEARDRVWQGVDKLKRCYLLLEGNNETQVKMHDVIRDVAIFISSKEKLIDVNWKSKGQFDKNSKWISVFKTSEYEHCDDLPMSNFQDLRLLIIHNLVLWPKHYPKISDISTLEGMQCLNVLSFREVEFGSSPEEIEWPNNLIILQLVRCNDLKSLSFVGNLLNLKILDCTGCNGIEELPLEIGKLKCLKMLNLSRCEKLQRIAPGIIKQLVALEELKMLYSFSKWESSKVNGKEALNVPLNELETLRKLTWLEIEIDDISLAHEKINLSSNLVKYKIRIQIHHSWFKRSILNYEKAICLGGLPNEIINDGSWIRRLLGTTNVEGLQLDGDGSGNWGNLSRNHKTLKVLEIRNCGMLKELVDSSTISIGSGDWGIFPMLEYLTLDGLSDLKQVCDKRQQFPFNNLREVEIRKCDKLMNIFLLEMANDPFIQLETLRIEECATMKQVFISNGKTSNTMTFPKLKKLELGWLPNLTAFWKGNESIEFPSLEGLDIRGCEQLNSMVCTEMESRSEHNCGNEEVTDRTLHLFCTHKVKLGRLKTLTLSGSILCSQISGSFFRTLEILNLWRCHNVRSLFSSLMVENLVSLRCLSIWNCDTVEELLKNKGEEKTRQVTFSKLKVLQLQRLPSLTSVGKGVESIEFPMLEELKIEHCPKLKRIVCPLEYHQGSGEGCNNDDEPFLFLCDDKVKFEKLSELTIIGCNSISSVFSSLAARNLTTLTSISISGCIAIKKVITGESEIHGNPILFPSLKTVEVEDTPLLEMLCEWKCPLELSMLEELSVDGCPHLKFLTSEYLSTPKLKKMGIDNKIFVKENWKVTEDLNMFLCQPMIDTTEVWKKLGVDVSEPSQLNTLLLPHHPLPFPLQLTYAVRLLYKSSGKALLAVTSNVGPKMWTWSYDNQSSASSLPKLQQHTDSILMSNDLINNDAKSTQDDSFACLALSKYDEHLIFVSGGTVSFFDMSGDFEVLDNFELLETCMAPPPAATYLAFDPKDSGVIAIGRDDSIIEIYDWEDGEVKTMLEGGHQKRISGLAFSKSLNILVSSGVDARLCVWSILGWEKKKSRMIQAPLAGHPAPLDGETRIQFHNDQYHLLVVHKSQIAIYDPELECLCSWYPRDSLSSPISCAMYSCDGWMIYTGFNDGAIGIFDFERLTLLCRIAPSAYISSPSPSNNNAVPMVMDIAAHPKDPNQFALGMKNGAVYVIEPLETQSSSWDHLNNQ